jgi:hypothetical protein
MSEFFYQTSESIRGPWLIPGEQLRALDKILTDEYARLIERNQKVLDADVEDQLRRDLEFESRENRTKEEIKQKRDQIKKSLRDYHRYTESRELVMFFDKDKRKMKVEKFEDALRESTLMDEVPTRFEAKIECGEIRCDVGLSKYLNTLDIRVSPEHLSEARELFVSLLGWAKANRPPKWQQLWRTFNGLQWILWMVVLFISFGVVSDSAKTAYKQEASALLQKGVSQENQLRAIEILLALQSDYSPPSREGSVPGWLKLLFFGGLITCIATSFAPKTILGIGKGEDKIRFWRWWLRFVFYLVPAFLFLNVVWPLVHDRVFGK